MKIVMVIKGLHETAGGAERIFCDVANHLAGRGHRVGVLSFDSPGEEPFYDLSGVDDVVGLAIGDVHRPTSPLIFQRRVSALRREILARRPDVVIAFMHSCFVPTALALIGTGIPVVASEHTVITHYRKRLGQLALYALSVPLLRSITVVSQAVKERFPRVIRRKMVVMPNPVALPAAVPEPALDAPPGRPARRILSIGRFDEAKGHGVLLEAFARIARDFPEWDLRIVGDGPTREALRQRAIALGLSERVAMPGIVRNIAAEWQACAVFALASRYESFGLVIAEAMAAGRPAIGFIDCPGVNTLIEDGRTGLLVGGEDRPAALAAGLWRLLSDPDLRQTMGAAAREAIAGQFHIERICDQWEALLSETLDP
ncbi:glycosyltransferase family 4 protein [Rhodospirillum rubrum]|uniref:Glycosyl transferase, group 1 n=3 Tax=Rhodospirillum rubrum TaxID=1085 RepID=Q2RRF3_RHORT|nr:glycosyltransferase family 4 protein [Rhodospirillum rubrum]ABC23292.1 Glycosyl transferase, group 1 [Rhodospirillum rubrum ATCC 11170]AEO49024.1 glycosyl transferase, group 1 [Rhodospirillum rubrum F11]MBK5954907.1 glycosyl transferase family 1 [Rhodospirillum rubrum]QXG79266.1 glycosyltransferase family 4 protein [Rhodospirillum rubrum]